MRIIKHEPVAPLAAAEPAISTELVSGAPSPVLWLSGPRKAELVWQLLTAQALPAPLRIRSFRNRVIVCVLTRTRTWRFFQHVYNLQSVQPPPPPAPAPLRMARPDHVRIPRTIQVVSWIIYAYA